jgi:hypothetical protein
VLAYFKTPKQFMKAIILSVCIIALASCSNNKWNKENLVSKCNKEFKKKNEVQKLFTEEQLGELCNCVADKMVTKYKSKAESDKDQAGASEIGRDCAMEVMQ